MSRTAQALEALAAPEGGDVAALLAELSDDRHRRGDPDTRLARLVALAVRTRLDPRREAGGNAYLTPVGGLAMVDAFEALVRATPFVRFGHAACRAAVLALSAPALHVVDVGVGQGTQWTGLLDALAARDRRPRLRLTGLDLPGPDARERLEAVGERLRVEAAQRGLALEWHGVLRRMEELDAGELGLRDGEALVVNLAFALHHTSTAGDPSPRDEVLRRLRALEPALLTLVEPDSDHDQEPLLPRARTAVAHYGTMFRALDALLLPEAPARRVLEEQFFGRELVDVLAAEGPARVERHQAHGQWEARLCRAGFRAVPLDAARVAADAAVAPPADVVADGASLVVRWEGVPMIGASAWTC